MSGIYTASAKLTNVNSARTLMALVAPVSVPIEILAAAFTSQSASSSQLACRLERISALGTPTWDLPNVIPSRHAGGDQNSSAFAYANCTANEPTYEGYPVGQQGFALASGWFFDPPSEGRFEVPAGLPVGLRILTASGGLTGFAEITYREGANRGVYLLNHSLEAAFVGADQNKKALLTIRAPDRRAVEIVSLSLTSKRPISDMWQMQFWYSATGSVGSGGTPLTFQKVDPFDQASQCTAYGGPFSSDPSNSAIQYAEAQNAAIGWFFSQAARGRLWIMPGQSLTFAWYANPFSLSALLRATIREVG